MIDQPDAMATLGLGDWATSDVHKSLKLNYARAIRADTALESRMDYFFDDLIARTATIDELLSDEFEPIPGQKSDADLAARRLAAWCQSCTSGGEF